MGIERMDLAGNIVADSRHTEGLFIEWSENLAKIMSSHFKNTMKRFNSQMTANNWFQEFCHGFKNKQYAGSHKSLYVYDHSFRVAELALMLAKEMRLGQLMTTNIHRGAYLHDIGKLGVSNFVLEKNGKPTEEEYVLIYMHPEIGSNIVEKFENLSRFKDVVRYHHERYDGKGYPDKLKGEDIPYAARIVAVADAFDAMIGPRVYRTPFSVSEAVREINDCSGSQFDPEIVKVLNETVNKLTNKE